MAIYAHVIMKKAHDSKIVTYDLIENGRFDCSRARNIS